MPYPLSADARQTLLRIMVTTPVELLTRIESQKISRPKLGTLMVDIWTP